MNRSVLMALGICVALVLYMLTGVFGCSREKPSQPLQPGERARQLMRVQVRDMEAVEIPREVVVTGRTVPSRGVLLKAETAGRVEWVADLRGHLVKAGEEIARLEVRDRSERLEQAQALLEQARFEYEAVQMLSGQGLRSPAQVAEALARLRGSEQAVTAMELDLEHTRVRAPFSGVLQDRHVEVGDYLGVGDPVAQVIDLDPLVVEGQVTEFQVAYVEPGEIGHAHLSGGRVLDGTIRYIAGEADPLARTFLVELEVPNPGNRVPGGITAEIRIETERVLAHRISPGLISIDDDGRFGIKIVDADDTVRFIEADIVRAEPDALWLGSLPPKMRLITVGQGFTQPGDKVEPVIETTTWE